MHDDVEREARRDWLDERRHLEPDDYPDPVEDTCEDCGRVLGNHEGPVCNRCLNGR